MNKSDENIEKNESFNFNNFFKNKFTVNEELIAVDSSMSFKIKYYIKKKEKVCFKNKRWEKKEKEWWRKVF